MNQPIDTGAPLFAPLQRRLTVGKLMAGLLLLTCVTFAVSALVSFLAGLATQVLLIAAASGAMHAVAARHRRRVVEDLAVRLGLPVHMDLVTATVRNALNGKSSEAIFFTHNGRRYRLEPSVEPSSPDWVNVTLVVVPVGADAKAVFGG